jgi:integrase
MFSINRNGWFHFRLRIPHDIAAIIGTSHIQCALKTRQKRIANKLSLELRDRITPHFQRLRLERLSGTDDIQLQRLAFELLPVSNRHRQSILSLSSLSVSDLVTAYLDDRSKHIDDRTILATQYVFDLFIWVNGDDLIKEVSRNDCRKFRDMMLLLPSRALRYSKSMSASDVAAMNYTPMNPKTVNKNIQFLSGLFNWAVSEELITDNPARGLTVGIKEKASSERNAYDAASLGLLIRNLSPSDMSPENYWLPLLGYFTGMRIEELCQLRIQDVMTMNGVHCIRVSSEAGSLKTINAERIVPIHSHLKQLGFIEFVNSLDATKSIRLWHALKANAYGKFSSAYSKRFGKFKRRIGINDKKLTFHSLRHTFANELKQAGVSEHVIAQLIGHSNSSITMGRYGKEYEVDNLSEAVEKLRLHERET